MVDGPQFFTELRRRAQWGCQVTAALRRLGRRSDEPVPKQLSTYEVVIAGVTVAIVLAMLAVVATEESSTHSLICDEPQIIAITETATGVVVRCGAVEGEP